MFHFTGIYTFAKEIIHTKKCSSCFEDKMHCSVHHVNQLKLLLFFMFLGENESFHFNSGSVRLRHEGHIALNQPESSKHRMTNINSEYDCGNHAL